MKEIKSFKDVERRICKDLAWYMCYESVSRTQQQLNMGIEDAYGSQLQESIFSYTLEKNFKDMLRRHVYQNQDIELGDQVINQAARFFSRQRPRISTMELSSYLSYLDSWCEAYPDWTAHHPVPLKNMVIIPSD